MNTLTLTRPTRPPQHVLSWDGDRFELADTIAKRLSGRSTADAATLDAVTILTSAADPDRAGRLAPRPAEPAVLVERLAVWALRQVDDGTVRRALTVLGHFPTTLKE